MTSTHVQSTIRSTRLSATRAALLHRCLFSVMLWLFCLPAVAAEETAFEKANRLYEQGDYAAAIYGFKSLAEDEPSPAILFNLGNAYFKAGQKGRAIYCYRWALQLAPRDPDVRANLRFVRHSVYGGRWRDPDFPGGLPEPRWGFGTEVQTEANARGGAW